MTQCNTLNIKLPTLQHNKLKSGTKNGTELKLLQIIHQLIQNYQNFNHMK